MTPLVTAAVLLAAVTHASWNAIAHRITDKLTGFALISGGGMLIGLALLPFTAFPAAGAWPYLLVSAAIHIAYYALLMRSFRLGDFGQAYPIARGSAPLLVTVLAAVFAHEVPDGWATGGVLVSCAGLTGVALWGLRGQPARLGGHRRRPGDRRDHRGVHGRRRPRRTRLRVLPRLHRLADGGAGHGPRRPASCTGTAPGPGPCCGRRPVSDWSARHCPSPPTPWSCGPRPAPNSRPSRPCASRPSWSAPR